MNAPASEIIRQAAELLDTLTSKLADNPSILRECTDQAKPLVEQLYVIGDRARTNRAWIQDVLPNGVQDMRMMSADELLSAAPTPPANAAPAAQGDAQTLTDIYDAFHIGAAVRKPHLLMVNIENVIRRARCLSAIEGVLTVETPPDPDEGDDEPGEECLLRWGADPDGYADHFREALAEFTRTQAALKENGNAQAE